MKTFRESVNPLIRDADTNYSRRLLLCALRYVPHEPENEQSGYITDADSS